MNEPVRQMTEVQARKATDKAKRDFGALRIQVANLYLAGADKALGYASWEEYATIEFSDLGLMLPREHRKAEVASLAELGYPTRAIAAAVGASQPTVVNDLQRSKPIAEDQPAEEEIVDAELVEEDLPQTPPKDRRSRTDVVATMTSAIRRAEAAGELAAMINATHLKSRPDEAAQWHRLLTPAVQQLSALLVQLEEAAE